MASFAGPSSALSTRSPYRGSMAQGLGSGGFVLEHLEGTLGSTIGAALLAPK
jgi:hypothetical protein